MDHARRRTVEEPTRAGLSALMSRVLPRDSEDSCHPKPNINLCEKPAISNTKLFIILTIFGAVFLCIFLGLLLFLHLRRRRMDRAEGVKDPQELDDYGMAPETPPPSHQEQMPPQPPPAAQRQFHQHQQPPSDPESYSQRAPSHHSRLRRMSEESLTPSLRQATAVTPRDALANK